jgi:hypothetical protein
VIMGSWNVNRGSWNVIMAPWNVNRGKLSVIMGYVQCDYRTV